MLSLNRLCLLIAGVALLATTAFAEDKPPVTRIVADDPAKVTDPDFAVQGEYTGEIKTEDGALRLGVQVIALGGGKFNAVGYISGLPGDGWDGSLRPSAMGETVDGVTTFVGEKARAQIKEGVLTISDNDGNMLGQLKRVVRSSPTLGAKPPEGAVVLFDGTHPDAFEKGRMTDDGLLMQGVTSKQKFQSFTLHLEFRLPYKPQDRGQGRGNSGFYAQGRYETQILDSFGLEGKNNECGGIYTIRDPSVNMCFPPLSWQTYDIEFKAATFDETGKKVKNATMTVRHNGVVVQDKTELTHATTAAPVKEGPEPGPVYLQDHGNPVRFRNIWVVEQK